MASRSLKPTYYDTANEELIYQNNDGGYTEVSGGGSSYLVYTALFTQDGTASPTIYELENTIASCQWNRNEAGIYKGVFDLVVSAQDIETRLWTSGLEPWTSGGSTLIPVTDYSGIIGYYIFSMNAGATLEIILEVLDDTFQYVEFSTLFGGGSGTRLAVPRILLFPAT